MAKSIPEILREHPGHKEWFAEVMTAWRAYGEKRAELALMTGKTSMDCLTEENFAQINPAFLAIGLETARLRDLIGMNILTVQDQIRTVADRWKNAYRHSDGKWASAGFSDSEAIWRKLSALPSTASAADIKAIIGNSSWTSLPCAECKQEASRVAVMGVDSYGDATLLCLTCLKAAQAALEIVQPISRDELTGIILNSLHDMIKQGYFEPGPKLAALIEEDKNFPDETRRRSAVHLQALVDLYSDSALTTRQSRDVSS